MNTKNQKRTIRIMVMCLSGASLTAASGCLPDNFLVDTVGATATALVDALVVQPIVDSMTGGAAH